LELKVAREYLPGMPWESEEKKKRHAGNNYAKMVFVIQGPTDQQERLKELLREAKCKKVWEKH
jgi:hypothetical protein